jgi:hypothetical protein
MAVSGVPEKGAPVLPKIINIYFHYAPLLLYHNSGGGGQVFFKRKNKK